MYNVCAYTACVLLHFLARDVAGHVNVAQKSYDLWNSDSFEDTDTDRSQARMDPMVPRQLDPDSQMSEWMVPKTNYTPFNVSEECILWDDRCKGDRKKALSIFFNETLNSLLQDKCFTSPGPLNSSPCTSTAQVPLASSSLWSIVKSWMREFACTSSALEYRSAYCYLARLHYFSSIQSPKTPFIRYPLD